MLPVCPTSNLLQSRLRSQSYEGYSVCEITSGVDYSEIDRRKTPTNEAIEPVRLKKKFADVLDGVSLVGFQVGDRLCLESRDAAVLIAEGWACPVPPGQRRRNR